MKSKKGIDNETIKYLVKHLSGVLPRIFSYEQLLSEALHLMAQGRKFTLFSFRAKLLDRIVLNNREYFERLKGDIIEIVNAYLFLSKKMKFSQVLEILWEEIGLSEKEKREFLLFIRGTPFIMCKDDLKERIDLIKRFVESLPDEEKLIIGLYYYEGLTLEEISDALQIDYKEMVLKFSLIAFKFLFNVCIKNLHKEEK